MVLTAKLSQQPSGECEPRVPYFLSSMSWWATSLGQGRDGIDLVEVVRSLLDDPEQAGCLFLFTLAWPADLQDPLALYTRLLRAIIFLFLFALALLWLGRLQFRLLGLPLVC